MIRNNTLKKKKMNKKIPKGLIEEEVALSLPPSELVWRKAGGLDTYYKLRPNIELWIGKSEDNDLVLKIDTNWTLSL